MKPKVFIAHKLIGDQLDSLKSKYEIETWETRDISHKDLLKQAVGASVLVSALNDNVNKEVMEAAGDNLRVICNYAVGFDNIDIDEATKRGIVVTNTPGVFTESVAEHVFALILAVSRRIVEGHQFVKSGKYKGWEPDLLIGTNLHGKTMGIVGLGRIGRWTARLAWGIGMKIVYCSKGRDEEMETSFGLGYRNLHQLLNISDVVSLNVPLTEETTGMIGKDQLALMKKTAILINTARGAVVDEEAMIDALKTHKIAGAGLDVYADEHHVNPKLIGLPNVVLTPHIASATIEARLSMTDLVIHGFTHVLGGIKPDNIVNPEVWDHRRR